MSAETKGLVAHSSSDSLDYQYDDSIIESERRDYKQLKRSSFIDWMKWNGVYVYSYGCALAGIGCALMSPVMNMHQGGNLYPYVSEVIRSGYPKLIFFIGSTLGCIPTIIFATNYLRVAFNYSSEISSVFRRCLYRVVEIFQYLLFLYSAISVIGVSLCDMDTLPDLHTVFSSSWIILTNIMEFNQLLLVSHLIYKEKYENRSYITYKAVILTLSIVGMINFAVLGSYVPCHSYNLSMEKCLLEYPEQFCFDHMIRNKNPIGRVTLRMYGKCPVLHFLRGVGEFISVLSTMAFLPTIVHDVKQMQIILDEKMGISPRIGISESESDSCYN